MDRSTVIYLLREEYTQDEYGVYRSQIVRHKVFADVSSVYASEWFEGGRNGLNPELRFRMFAPEYKGEKILEYKGDTFSIYRTYQAKNDIVELYTERKQGDYGKGNTDQT